MSFTKIHVIIIIERRKGEKKYYMAITVIKHGNALLRATCPKCGCEFEFLNTDMDTYGNQIAQYESINCPDCHYKMTWLYGEKSGRSKVTPRPYQ